LPDLRLRYTGAFHKPATHWHSSIIIIIIIISLLKFMGLLAGQMERNCADVVTILNASAHAPETKKAQGIRKSHNKDTVLHAWLGLCTGNDWKIENKEIGLFLQKTLLGGGAPLASLVELQPPHKKWGGATKGKRGMGQRSRW